MSDKDEKPAQPRAVAADGEYAIANEYKPLWIHVKDGRVQYWSFSPSDSLPCELYSTKVDAAFNEKAFSDLLRCLTELDHKKQHPKLSASAVTMRLGLVTATAAVAADPTLSLSSNELIMQAFFGARFEGMALEVDADESRREWHPCLSDFMAPFKNPVSTYPYRSNCMIPVSQDQKDVRDCPTVVCYRTQCAISLCSFPGPAITRSSSSNSTGTASGSGPRPDVCPTSQFGLSASHKSDPLFLSSWASYRGGRNDDHRAPSPLGSTVWPSATPEETFPFDYKTAADARVEVKAIMDERKRLRELKEAQMTNAACTAVRRRKQHHGLNAVASKWPHDLRKTSQWARHAVHLKDKPTSTGWCGEDVEIDEGDVDADANADALTNLSGLIASFMPPPGGASLESSDCDPF